MANHRCEKREGREFNEGCTLDADHDGECVVRARPEDHWTPTAMTDTTPTPPPATAAREVSEIPEDFIPTLKGKNTKRYIAREVMAETAEVKRLATLTFHEVEQTLGKALGYPWFKDDQKNFPGATEKDGVCVGEHVPETIAAEAARRLVEAKEECAEVTAIAYALESAINLAGNYPPQSKIVKEQEVKACRLFNTAFAARNERKLVGVPYLRSLRDELVEAKAERDGEWMKMLGVDVTYTPPGLEVPVAVVHILDEQRTMEVRQAKAEGLREALGAIRHWEGKHCGLYEDVKRLADEAEKGAKQC